MQSLRSRIYNAGVAAFPHDDLPISRIGIVQPHGIMAVTDAAGRTIEHISANVEELLGRPPHHVLGRDIMSLFDDYDSRRAIENAAQPGRIYFDNPIRVIANGREFEVVVHQHDGMRFFEIEPFVAPDRDYGTLVSQATAELAACRTSVGLFRAAADLLQQVTGYDRVMLYRFEGRGHGQVIAERRSRADLLSFDGLYFPAADIPAEARQILTNGKTRYTPCVTRTGSPMLRLDGANNVVESGDVIDMTHAWLRGVHACHNGYMSHIATKGSMVFPVMVDDQLWGLFVCHNDEEKYLDYESRVVVEQMTMMFICKLLELEQIEARLDMRREQMERMREALAGAADATAALGGAGAAQRSSAHALALAALGREMANLAPAAVATETLGNDPARRLSAFEEDLLGFVKADSAAVIRDGQVRLVGDAPNELVALAIAQAFGTALPSLAEGPWRVYATNCLPSLYPNAQAARDKACGVLAAALDASGRDAILWFRREEIVDATWAGRPPSEEELKSSTMNTPRSSFGRVRQEISGAARDWTEAQVAMAAEFADGVRDFLQGRGGGGPVRAAERTGASAGFDPNFDPPRPASAPSPHVEPVRIRTRETLGDSRN